MKNRSHGKPALCFPWLCFLPGNITARSFLTSDCVSEQEIIYYACGEKHAVADFIPTIQEAVYLDRFKIGKNISGFRTQMGISQDKLAEIMSVTKSAVSKWESGATLPDVFMLARLSSYFNITMDELVGYEPQLSKEEINRLYCKLTGLFTVHPESALKECERLIGEYYSCLPFIEQMAVLMLNHFMLFEDKEKILQRVIELCSKVVSESTSHGLVKEAASIEAAALLSKGEPDRVIEMMNRDNEILDSDMELIAQAYAVKGDMVKSGEIFEMAAFQHLIFALQDSLNLMVVREEDVEFGKETLNRVFQIMELYGIEKIHPSTAYAAYITAASYFAKNGSRDECCEMLVKFTKIMERLIEDICVVGSDHYFKNMDKLMNRQLQRMGFPRDTKFIIESAVAAVRDNPLFGPYLDEPDVKRGLEALAALEFGNK